MRMRNVLAAVLVSVAALAARAESVDVDGVTLGAMTERADAVVVAEAAEAPADGRAWRLRVVEVLRGALDGPDVDVDVRAGAYAHHRPAPLPLRAGRPYLLFLEARTGRGGVFTPLELPWAARDTTDAGVAALLDYTRRYASAFRLDGTLERPRDLVQLLVESLGARASGVPACAGRDLLRHAELVPLLTDAQRRAVDAAVAAPRKADADLAAILDAAGVAGTPACEPALVARLLDPATRHLRMNVTAALRRHARPETVGLLASKLDGADPAQRADLVNALGRLDRAETAPFLLDALSDAESPVRVEAAHSTGLLARAVRAPKPGVDVEAPREKLTAAEAPLLAALAAAKSETEQRALAWALAQIDTQEAWTGLKRLRDEAKDARVRELCAYYLLHPRVELILER